MMRFAPTGTAAVQPASPSVPVIASHNFAPEITFAAVFLHRDLSRCEEPLHRAGEIRLGVPVALGKELGEIRAWLLSDTGRFSRATASRSSRKTVSTFLRMIEPMIPVLAPRLFRRDG